MGTRAANVLRAVVAGARETGDKRQVRARLERAWDGLSIAEKTALGGTLVAALFGGGLLLRSGLNAMTRPLSIAEMRPMTTENLLRSFESGNDRQKAAIAQFCVCRVHDLLESLFGSDKRLEIIAYEILSHVYNALKDSTAAGTGARRSFIRNAFSMLSNKQAFLVVFPKHANGLRIEGLGKLDDAQVVTKNTEVSISKTVVTKQPSHEQPRHEPYESELLETMKIPNKSELVEAIKRLQTNKNLNGYHSKYGHIACWDVRKVTDMSYAFEYQAFGKTLGFLDLSFWDTRKVRTMSGMFRGYEGDVEVGMWDTREVTDMQSMFANAGDFNGDIGNWDTRNVENMASMFRHAKKFNCDIGSWSTSKVENTDSMFLGASTFNQDLSAWKLGSLKDFESMFEGSGIENDEKKKPKKARSGNANGSMQLVFGRASPRAYV